MSLRSLIPIVLFSSLTMPVPARATELETAPLPSDLAPYRWQNRLLILRAPGATDPQFREQVAQLARHQAELAARDLKVFADFGATAFAVELIGKDGGRKVRQATVLPPAELFAIIDAMPMRRAEMRRESTGL